MNNLNSRTNYTDDYQVLLVNDRNQDVDLCSPYKLHHEFNVHRDLFRKRPVTLEELKITVIYDGDGKESFIKDFTPYFIMYGDWRIALVLCSHNKKGEAQYTYLHPNMEEVAYYEECSDYYDKEHADYGEYVVAKLLEDIRMYLDTKDAA